MTICFADAYGLVYQTEAKGEIVRRIAVGDARPRFAPLGSPAVAASAFGQAVERCLFIIQSGTASQIALTNRIVSAQASALVRGVASALVSYSPKIVEQGRDVLAKFCNVFSSLDGDYPPLSVAQAEDGSAMIEWMLPSARLGVSLHENVGESSWFLVSTPEFGNLMLSGDLATAKIDELVRWAINPQRKTK